MKFYFTNDIDPDFLQREAYRDLYIKRLKEVVTLRKRNRKASERQRIALETSKGARTNANHKSDMAIMQNNNQITKIQKELDYIDSIYNFNMFDDNLVLYNMNKKVIDEYKEYN